VHFLMKRLAKLASYKVRFFVLLVFDINTIRNTYKVVFG
jgi:hypothetical protein